MTDHTKSLTAKDAKDAKDYLSKPTIGTTGGIDLDVGIDVG
jgi:hypothetical protein